MCPWEWSSWSLKKLRWRCKVWIKIKNNKKKNGMDEACNSFSAHKSWFSSGKGTQRMYKNLVATVLLVSKTHIDIRTHTSVEKNAKPLNCKMLVNQLWLYSAPIVHLYMYFTMFQAFFTTSLSKSSYDLVKQEILSKEWVTIFIWISLTPGGNEGKGGTAHFCECNDFLSNSKTLYFYWDSFWVGNINNKASFPVGHLLK